MLEYKDQGNVWKRLLWDGWIPCIVWDNPLHRHSHCLWPCKHDAWWGHYPRSVDRILANQVGFLSWIWANPLPREHLGYRNHLGKSIAWGKLIRSLEAVNNPLHSLISSSTKRGALVECKAYSHILLISRCGIVIVLINLHLVLLSPISCRIILVLPILRLVSHMSFVSYCY